MASDWHIFVIYIQQLLQITSFMKRGPWFNQTIKIWTYELMYMYLQLSTVNIPFFFLEFPPNIAIPLFISFFNLLISCQRRLQPRSSFRTLTSRSPVSSSRKKERKSTEMWKRRLNQLRIKLIHTYLIHTNLISVILHSHIFLYKYSMS